MHYYFFFRCAQCDGAILDQCVSALDKTWHPEHFVCASCSNPFGVSQMYMCERNCRQLMFEIHDSFILYLNVFRMMGIKKTMAKHFAWNAMLKRLHPAAVDVPLQLSTIIFPLLVCICNFIC